MELRMQYATTRDGVRIAFGTAGAGPWIVRAPGIPFTHCQLEWEQGSDFFDQRAANWSVVQFDPRGTGLSDRNVEDFSLEARMLDLEAVVDRLGLDTFALHGINWSGPVAVTYTLRHPDRVSHLILDDSLARSGDFMDTPQVRALDQLVEEWDSFLEHMVFTFFGLGREQARPHTESADAGAPARRRLQTERRSRERHGGADTGRPLRDAGRARPRWHGEDRACYRRTDGDGDRDCASLAGSRPWTSVRRAHDPVHGRG